MKRAADWDCPLQKVWYSFREENLQFYLDGDLFKVVIEFPEYAGTLQET